MYVNGDHGDVGACHIHVRPKCSLKQRAGNRGVAKHSDLALFDALARANGHDVADLEEVL
eukprot:1938309-Rhodomonas_salina.1